MINLTYYKTCEICGSNLDPGEKCECQIVNDCDWCAYNDNKKGLCFVCSVKNGGKYNYFHNKLIQSKDKF